MANSNSMSQPLEYDLRKGPREWVQETSLKMIQKAIPKPVTMKRFQDKVAIVTESTEGVGFSIAERLGKEGAFIVITTSKQGSLEGAVRKLTDQSLDVLYVFCDLSNAQQRKDLIDKTLQKYKKIDIIVSNGVAKPSMNAVLKIQEPLLDQLWEVNVKSHLLLLQDAQPHLKEGSSIVIVSSVTSDQPQASLGVNDVTKAALIGVTKALSKEMFPNVRVNGVLSGFAPPIAAPQGHKTTGFFKEGKGTKDKTSLPKLGSSMEIAATVAFLASDEAFHVTGEAVVVFGGIASNL